MEIKFDVYFKKNLGTLFKSNEVDLDGIPAHTNLDLISYQDETNYIASTGAISPKSSFNVNDGVSDVVKLL